MRVRHIGIAAGLAAVLVGTTNPTAARAGGQGDPLYGDVNGDRRTDRITLTAPTVDTCAVDVELGLPNSRYASPRRYPYPAPGDPVASCPDLGVVADLGGDGTVELVLAWFDGRPPGVDTDLLVLRDFTPAEGFTAVYQPSFLGTADFDGDRRRDLYEWTDQGEGFVTLLNTADGRLVPGPVHWCSGLPGYRLADFDRDGATDVVITYTEGCDDFANGVVVVLDDGTVTHLEHDSHAVDTWTVEVVDANADGIPDVRTVSSSGETKQHLGRGDGTFVEAPRADNDVAVSRRGHKVDIAVLANDAATTAARLSIVSAPTHGTVQITSRRTIVYTPAPGHGTRERFVYRLTDGGRSDNAAVTVRFR